jgi:hypothetical protein
MPIHRYTYAVEAYDTILKLVPIGGATGAGAPAYHGFLGTVTNAIIPLLTVAIQQTGEGKVYYPPSLNDPQLDALVSMVHRAYYTSLLSAIEGACDGFARTKSSAPVPRQGKKHLEFADYLKAALDNSNMPEDRKRHWRKYFHAIRILRNKCSHFSAALEPHEKTALIDAGLAAHISPSGDVQTQPANYVPIAESALEFLREL